MAYASDALKNNTDFMIEVPCGFAPRRPRPSFLRHAAPHPGVPHRSTTVSHRQAVRKYRMVDDGEQYGNSLEEFMDYVPGQVLSDPQFFQALVQQLSENCADQWPECWKPIIAKMEYHIGEQHAYALWHTERWGLLAEFNSNDYSYRKTRINTCAFWLECEFEGEEKLDGEFLWKMPDAVIQAMNEVDYERVRI